MKRVCRDVEAIHHFRQANEHHIADELARTVCNFYYNRSNYADASALSEEIVTRGAPPPPWWALNRYGMCQLRLGSPDNALAAFERALTVVPTREDEGTTLNNLSQIYDARGDYATALGYLEQSLTICREIGDKAGEGATLNNLGQIYDARGDYATALGYLEQSLTIQREIGDKAGMIGTLHNMAYIALQANKGEQALTLWSEALQLARETQNAQGLFHVAGTLGTLHAQAGNKEQAEPLLRLAIDAGRQAGFPDVQELEETLRGLA